MYDGADWMSVTTSPAGEDTEIQFNKQGVFGTDEDLRFDGVVLHSPAFAGDGSQLTNLNIPGIAGIQVVTLMSPNPAPAAQTGDYYLNTVAGVAVGSWTGISGTAVADNQFVYYTVNDEWVLGAIQSDEGLVTVAGATSHFRCQNLHSNDGC